MNLRPETENALKRIEPNQSAAQRAGWLCQPSNSFDGLVIVWRVTEGCNLDCLFCGYARSIQRPRATADPDQILAFGALLRDASRAIKARSSVVGGLWSDPLVSWLGGEPLLWPPLMDITRTFKHEFGLRVSVTTNGTTLDSVAAREHVAADYDEITISLDGIGELNDRLRGASGLCERLRAHITALRELAAKRGHGPLIRVNTILMRENIYQFESLCRAVAGWGVEELTFNTLGGRDRPEFYPDHRLWPEHVKWLCAELPGIRERMSRLGLRVCGSSSYLERIASTAQGIPIPVADCAPGQRFLFIDERGLISPCSFTTAGYGIPLNEIKNPSDLHQLPARFAMRQREQTLPPCLDCVCTEVFGKFDARHSSLVIP